MRPSNVLQSVCAIPRWRVASLLGLATSLLASGSALAKPATTVLITRSGAMLVTRNAGFLDLVDHADPVVKFVMLILLAASVTTWTIWIMKTVELRRAKTMLAVDYDVLYASQSLKEAEQVTYPTTRTMVELARAEWLKSGASKSWRSVKSMEERVASLLPILEGAAMHRILVGTNLLASIGAVSPFVGLAGTVWGIMNSFMGISKSQSTSLAVVAPGIAEALLATAMGLAAAIPAVLIYNSLSRAIAGYRRLLNSSAQLIVCALGREAERLYERDHGEGSGPEDERIGSSPEVAPLQAAALHGFAAPIRT